MFSNYFKTAWRNILKNKTYSLLNIIGLAVGIGCAALIFLWVEHEVSYNNYFKNKPLLYSVKDKQSYAGKTYVFDATPGPLASAMKTDIPGIKYTSRSTNAQPLFSLGDKNIYESGNFVDSDFFKMFHLQFIAGNPDHAFDHLQSIVISESMAKKFFSGTDAVGKTLELDHHKTYQISGVFKDLPENVSFSFNWLAPFQVMVNNYPDLKTWGNNWPTTYVEVQPNANIEAINKLLYDFVKKKTNGDLHIAKLSIYPMSRWVLYNNFVDGKEAGGIIQYVKLFSLIACFILIIACINFMNLATARSEKRAREVGVRKTFGAGKTALRLQFLAEAVLIAAFSTLLAICLVALTIHPFNALLGTRISLHIFTPVHLAAVAFIILVCGFLAGSYPAFFLSSFNPVLALKGLKANGVNRAAWIRKGLVILQFSISVILIISTIVIYSQIQHVKNRDLGYNKHGLVYTSLSASGKKHFSVIKHDLLQTGYVQDACLSTSTVLQIGSNTGDFTWPGKTSDKKVLITIENVSPGYVPTMGMKLKAGRNFYTDMKADSNQIIINNSLAEIIGNKNIIGSTISRDSTKYTIVGVVDNFLYNSMYTAPMPLILFPDTSSTYVLSMRYKSGINFPTANDALVKTIKADNPGFPVYLNFIDDQFNNFFAFETMVGTLAGIFAILAIFISCLGLFGLAAFMAEQRTKEIGVRKVTGASVSQIVVLFLGDFTKLVLVSCLIAFPIAWLFMHNWLNNYEYRISIHWYIFLVAAVMALVISLTTVSFQALRAAWVNPVKSLRTE